MNISKNRYNTPSFGMSMARFQSYESLSNFLDRVDYERCRVVRRGFKQFVNEQAKLKTFNLVPQENGSVHVVAYSKREPIEEFITCYHDNGKAAIVAQMFHNFLLDNCLIIFLIPKLFYQTTL